MVALHSSALNVQVDYPRMFAALKEVGYDWFWVFEVGWDQAQTNVNGWQYLRERYG